MISSPLVDKLKAVPVTVPALEPSARNALRLFIFISVPAGKSALAVQVISPSPVLNPVGFPFVPSIQALSVKLSVVPFPIGTNITNEKESSGGFASEVYPVNAISPATKVVGVNNNFLDITWCSVKWSFITISDIKAKLSMIGKNSFEVIYNWFSEVSKTMTLILSEKT